MDFELRGKVAIVTGASRGLGAAITRAFALEGAAVIATSRHFHALDDLRAAFPSQVHGVEVDLREPERVCELPEAALSRFGRLDIVVNNAGIAPSCAFLDQSPDVWREVFAVNVDAPAALTLAAGRHLVAQGSGKVINVASIAGIRGKATLAAYSASKGALIQFTRAVAAEWAHSGVQVNAVAPGAFGTTAQRRVLESPELLDRRIRKIPARRIAQPDEIGAMILYLASSVSDFVTGAVFTIDGGETAKI